ncbi:tRNA pseudouridine synthase B [Ruminiclostridium papyrosolvens DSM 2782]|uniref:tRNA pseudouridine synthase B n=1 Tax=Ruminiclostridium papyrosolvens DSM 2782 TaxID=588581 RepID=F1TG52_9FIRM|nr:tRNA pseudouridine(55) synthase TruB [Ruminiclostridium papyrosolvens]EGD46671.1 tRNA pseudouridine synthase B [Ruminiclostridium papyrosolvens DSM 2782]WES35822.1 tRNA pseudouridine(55) synthase TruB [Ruminiclostridium papyrosolvens DSM 2782]
MNGILNVLKPAGMTSFDVIGFMRRITGQKKIGHAGTLDPSAVGVLPLCIGNATRALEFMIDKDKVYRAELTLGVSTDTQDSSGIVLDSYSVEVNEDEIKKTVMSFVGTIEQLPPMYSAIKIGGKKLYELARQGQTIERESRTIQIYSIDVIRVWEDSAVFDSEGTAKEFAVKKALLDVHCSKGTYIRTLCNDIGDKLGCGGHMSFLVRTRAGQYNLDNALTMEEVIQLSETKALEGHLLPVEKIFEVFDSIKLSNKELFKYNNGVWLEVEKNKYKKTVYRVYDNNSFLGIGEVFEKENTLYLKSKKFFK